MFRSNKLAKAAIALSSALVLGMGLTASVASAHGGYYGNWGYGRGYRNFRHSRGFRGFRFRGFRDYRW